MQRNEFTRGAFIEGSLEVKLRTIWTDGKAEVGRVSEEKRREEKRSEAKRSEAKRSEEKKKRRSKEKKQREAKRSKEKQREAKRRSEKRKSQRKEDAGARKGSRVAKHCVFPMVCGSGGSTSRVAKAAGAEP